MCQMASISGKGEVAVNERGVGEQWKGFGLDLPSLLESVSPML